MLPFMTIMGLLAYGVQCALWCEHQLWLNITKVCLQYLGTLDY